MCYICTAIPMRWKSYWKWTHGFSSRINFHIYFEDYKPKELLEIFKYLSQAESYVLDKNIEDILIPFFEKEIPKTDFSNARMVRNVYEKAKFIQATRVIDDDKENKDLIIQDDVKNAIQLLNIKNENKHKIGFKI